MSNINLENSKPSLVKIPKGYPMVPSPGKISLLFEENYNDIYHKFNPRDYDNGNIFLGANQPYIYRYPTERQSDIGGRGLPLLMGVDDVVRVSKFIGSGRGLLFVGKQFLLQGYQSFDETNIYNPTEVILAATSNLTGQIIPRPKRHIDKSGGLLGGLAAMVGVGISRGLPPASTVAAGNGSGEPSEGTLFGGISLLGKNGNNREDEVLPVQNYGNATGLLRARTANKARSVLSAKWGTATSGNNKGGVLSYLNGLAKSMFPQVYGSDKQNYKQRADDITYDWMVKYYNDVTAKGMSNGNKTSGLSISFLGFALKKGNTTSVSTKISQTETKQFQQNYYKISETQYIVYSPTHNKQAIINPEFDSYEESSKIKNINEQISLSDYRKDVINRDTVSKTNDSLKKVLDKIHNGGIYKVQHNNRNTFLLSSGQTSKSGYERLYEMSANPYSNLKNNPNSIESEYIRENIRTLDFSINGAKNYGFASVGRPDTINTLVVLDDDRKIKDQLISGYTEWNPYDDDLIAFFFYDVVNKKYIPFRATVKGISESNNALWDELRFMGRADAIYSYTGFTRNLSFSFTVVVNSLIELLPVWNRINYLASSVKPSGYTTKNQDDKITNRFVIPPMFMLTIGDLYKYQPIVITTVSVNIPENAVWELVPEKSVSDWSHLANIIKSTVTNGRVGQVPREIEISIACNVLEKERPEVGGNHFGHAPKNVDGNGYVQIKNEEFLPTPSPFSMNMRTDVWTTVPNPPTIPNTPTMDRLSDQPLINNI